MADRHAPLVKTATVPLGPDAAFKLFTHGFSHWWPLATHSVGEANALDCRMEEHAGGHIVELDGDGSTHVWGTIRHWQPPRLMSFTWHPGRSAETAQTIEVRFDPSEDGGTVVTLTHGDWNAYGERAAAMRANYDKGWDFVLGERFVSTACDS